MIYRGFMLKARAIFDMIYRAGAGVQDPFPALATTVNWIGVGHAMTESHPITPGVTYKDIPGFSGYCVGDDGSVWSCKSGIWRRMKAHENDQGYLRVDLQDGATSVKRFKVHRLVLEAFRGPCPPGKESCHHPDPDPANCRLENLRWDTSKSNNQDKVRQGRAQVGEASSGAKLTTSDVIRIMEMDASGLGPGEIAARVGTTSTNIQAILRGSTWNHVTGLPPHDPEGSISRRAAKALKRMADLPIPCVDRLAGVMSRLPRKGSSPRNNMDR